MNYDRWKSKQWLDLLSIHREPLVTVITTHLLVEHGLDYLLATHASKEAPVVDELLGFSFARKAKLVYQLGLLPKELYDNIARLNKLRNGYAHELNVDFSSADLDYHDPEGRVRIKDFHETISYPPTAPEIQNVLAWVGLVTFGWLHGIIVATLSEPEDTA